LILVIDNFDSFTYNLVDYFQQLGQNVDVKRNNLRHSDLIADRYSGVVLSPGPGIPENAGALLEVIDYYAGRKPLLGICLGHQAIAVHYGGKLKKANKPMHGKISNILHEVDPIFKNIPDHFNVVRYHSLVCDQLPDGLMTIAKSSENEIMAIRHQCDSVYGIQFHPEAALTDFGLEILRNWINLILVRD